MNLIIFLCLILKLLFLSFVRFLAPNPGNATMYIQDLKLSLIASLVFNVLLL